MEVFQGFVFQTAAICAVIGYLLGNFQTAIVVSRCILKDDVRDHGSGNPGATNVARLCGLPWGVVTLACDLLKGLIVSLLTYLLYKRVERLFFRRGSTQNC